MKVGVLLMMGGGRMMRSVGVCGGYMLGILGVYEVYG